MENIVKNMIEKISSYDILNNLLPGIIFCSIVERTTRIQIFAGEIWEKIFLYYFAGMIISRIGSIFKIKNNLIFCFSSKRKTYIDIPLSHFVLLIRDILYINFLMLLLYK